MNDDSPIFVGYHNNKKTLAITTPSINSAFDKCSLAIWHDLELKRFSPHDFRDFLQSGLENAGINANLISPILGHKVKGIDNHYSSHGIEELKEKYKTALPYLLPQTNGALKSELEATKIHQQKEIDNLKIENFNSQHKFSALISALAEKGISLNFDKLLKAHESKYQDAAKNPEKYYNTEERVKEGVLMDNALFTIALIFLLLIFVGTLYLILREPKRKIHEKDTYKRIIMKDNKS